MHLVNGISWRNIITAVISAAVLICVCNSVFCIKQISELHIAFFLLAQSQHNVWTLYRGHGICTTNSRLLLAFMHLGIVAHTCQLYASLVNETHRTAIHELWNKVVGYVSAVHLRLGILAQFLHHILHNVLHFDKAPYLI